MTALRVLVAPDSFSGSLGAREAAEAIAEGWLSARAGDAVTILPQADGGVGTLDAVEAAVPGARRRSAGLVTGPDGTPVSGEWLELPDGTAVVELAQCSGMTLMRSPDPLGATTMGLGEVASAAIAAGARSLVIGLGGSASTEGGAGALCALGLRIADAAGHPLPIGGAALAHAVTVDRSLLLTPPPGGVTVLADVTAPLLGARGAAAVFAPQKGATAAEVVQLDAALARFAGVLGGDHEFAGAGAAGGCGFGFVAAWGARIESGSAWIARVTGLDDAVAGSDLVLSGEGRFDEQSTRGKAVGGVLAAATRAGVRAGVIAGQLAAPSGVWEASLSVLAGSVAASLAEPERWLRAAGARAAREIA